ncbi:hypothetical protein N7457_009818 [Penicillium paradoxum]|uniref:uncharacterized protein n=1 Tax=Penicillium paradoxum TaxID=176176 RepID=UPI0025469D81|nr:uncharacterized protein N7457_009818 [Penicillium paradoxum]KAJ5774922.1 hypothetical protein N7457_009818 [Penicillium paradoxum]
MPPVTSKSSPELRIVLKKATPFIRGEAVCGHVLGTSPFGHQYAAVCVRLYGRTEVNVHSGGMTHQTLRSRFKLFEIASEALEIHQDSLQTSSNGPEDGKWPFTIQLPKHPNLASLRWKNEYERSYLPLSDASSQALPPTFWAKGRHTEGFVEYYLEATMRSSSSKKHKYSWTGKKYTTFQAIQTICVQSNLSSNPIMEFNIKHHSVGRQRIASQRLVTGMDSRLSVGQKIKKILGSSQLPVYSFSLQFDFATELQIGNPKTIPLRLKASTVLKDTSELIKTMLPTILVKQFTLTLLSTTHCNCKRLRFDSDGIPVKSSLILADYLWKRGHKRATDVNETLPDAQSDAASIADTIIVPRDSTSVLDLGIVLGIRTPISSRGTKTNPTFTTYNIKSENHIEWQLKLAIAGEIARVPQPFPDTPSNVLEQFPMAGKVVVVTGAADGLGYAVTQAMAEDGAHVALWYNSNEVAIERAQALAKEYSIKASGYQVDVSELTQASETIFTVVEDFDKIDVFIAIAGTISKPILEQTLDEYRKPISVNIDGIVNCAKYAGEVFARQGHGSLIITSSMSVHIVNVPTDPPVYNATKAYVTHFGKSLARERRDFARVNIVSPGFFDTKMGAGPPGGMSHVVTWKTGPCQGN